MLEAAHAIVALQGLNGRWPGVTVNVGVVHGGTRTNVVAERCELQVDLRSPALETLQAAEAEIERICAEHVVPDVTTEVVGHGWHRPMEKKEGAARLVEIAVGVAGELGFELRDAATGGASDANTTSAAGTPTIDGLGPVGGDDHAPAEWLDLEERRAAGGAARRADLARLSTGRAERQRHRLRAEDGEHPDADHDRRDTHDLDASGGVRRRTSTLPSAEIAANCDPEHGRDPDRVPGSPGERRDADHLRDARARARTERCVSGCGARRGRRAEA